MRKELGIFALGAILLSCGGGSAADIDVKSIDSACGCAEAAVIVLEEQNDLGRDMIALGEDPSEDDQQRILELRQFLKSKRREIEKHCKGDLNPRKLEEDNCAALEELEKLKDEQKILDRQL